MLLNENLILKVDLISSIKNFVVFYYVYPSDDRYQKIFRNYIQKVYLFKNTSNEDSYCFRANSLCSYLGEIYLSITSYVAENDDEISYEVGEEIEVLNKSKYGWWKVR